jgi:SAM-dependent methyltransferase
MISKSVDYRLPSDYRTNSATSLDQKSTSSYWTPRRAKVANRFQEPFYDWVADVVSELSPSRVADVGCGTAVKLAKLSTKFPTISFLGVDQPGFVKKVRESVRAELLELNLDLDPKWNNDQIDLVICSDVIEHLSRPEKLLGLISLMIGADGVCMISTPDRAVLRGKRNRYSPNPSHVREWTIPEFGEFLESQGFLIIEKKRLAPIRIRPDVFSAKWLSKRLLQLRGFRTNQAFLVRNR